MLYCRDNGGPTAPVHFRNMYEKDKTLLLVASASALPNNLSCKMLESSRISEAISVVHGGFINVVPLKSAPSDSTTISRYIPCSEDTSDRSTAVTQVMWCYLSYEICLAVASTIGLQIFDSATLELRFSHSCRDERGHEPKGQFARGLANPARDYICVGNNAGVVRLFGMGDDGRVMFIDRKQGHSCPVSDLASSKELLASADDAGSIILWKVTPDELLRWAEITSFGSAATSLQIWANVLIVGYGSGHLRLFSLNSGRNEVCLLTEVAAHAKWITAIDVAPESGLVLTVSEDSFAKIWQITKGNSISVVHRFSSQVKDSMLVGGKFLTLTGSMFAVSIYDSNLVQCFKM